MGQLSPGFLASVTPSTTAVRRSSGVARPADSGSAPSYRAPVSWFRFIPTSLPDHPLGDLAHLLRRQRAPQVLAALALAVLSAALLLRSEARAAGAERHWGSMSVAVVARHELRSGTELGPAQVRLRRLPTATLAADALTEPAWNEMGRGAQAPVIDRNVAENEPIRSGILIGDGAPGAGDGSVVAFPAGTLAPRLEAGDRVRVVAGQASDGGVVDGNGQRFTSAPTARGVVVGPPVLPDDDVDAGTPTGSADGSVGWVAWVAVPPRDADEVARIALSGSVALVLDSPVPADSGVNSPNLDGSGDAPP